MTAMDGTTAGLADAGASAGVNPGQRAASQHIQLAALRTRHHAGMPPINEDGPPVSPFEFWPSHVFYAPAVAYMFWLSLKHRSFTLSTVANPRFPYGGIVGESKTKILDQFQGKARALLARYISLQRNDRPAAEQAQGVLKALHAAGLQLPAVIKPDEGCRGVGVRLIESEAELTAYLEGFPKGLTFLLQEFVDKEGEAGVFYIRRPGERRGRIFSITLKYFPFVVGDGRRTLGALIDNDSRAGQLKHIYAPRHAERLDWVVPDGEAVRLAFAGSHSRGAIFRDGTALATPQMTAVFDAIADDVPEFYFGRFDIRFDDIDEVRAGKGFRIIELNGGAGEATHIWDNRMTLRKAYGVLFEQYRMLWEIGAANRKRGFRPVSIPALWKAWQDEIKLWRLYPPTQ